jgi:hypothetical protein
MQHAPAPHTQTGLPSRALEFPSRAIGTLAWRPWGNTRSEDWIYVGKARGRVTVPAGHEVRLDLDRRAVEDLAPLAALPHDALQGLSFRDTEPTDRALSHIAGLTGLLGLDLGGTNIGENGLAWLSRLTALRGLNLRQTRADDLSLASVGALDELAWLNLSRTRIADAGMAHLTRLHKLRNLNLEGTTVSDHGLSKLAGLQGILQLNLTATHVTDSGLRHLSTMTELNFLDLSETSISDAGIPYLLPHKSLRKLDLWQTEITQDGDTKLRQSLPNCSIAY